MCFGDNVDFICGGSWLGYCFVYEIVILEIYNWDYRLLEVENIGGFLEVWLGGSNVKWNGIVF